MQYKEKLIALILDTNKKAFADWLSTKPLLEQVVILKEFRLMTQQNMFKSQDFSIAENLKKLTKNIEKYEIKVLEVIKAEKECIEAFEAHEMQLQKIEAEILESKKNTINCIINNESNAPEKLELARKFIAIEKETGSYDENLWKPILKLL